MVYSEAMWQAAKDATAELRSTARLLARALEDCTLTAASNISFRTACEQATQGLNEAFRANGLKRCEGCGKLFQPESGHASDELCTDCGADAEMLKALGGTS